MPAKWYDRNRANLPADDGRILLGGRPLARYGAWLTSDGIELGDLSVTTGMTSIPGRPAADLTLEDEYGRAIPARRTITVHLVTAGSHADCLDSLTELGRLVGATCTIEDRAWEGHYEGRCTGIVHTMKPRHGAILIDLTLDALPWLIGHERSRSLPAGTVTIPVGGNAATPPTISLTPRGTTQIRVSDGTRIWTYTPPASLNGGTLTIDCANQRATYRGNPAIPDLTADWPVLTPRRATITTNTAGTIAWRPRTIQ